MSWMEEMDVTEEMEGLREKGKKWFKRNWKWLAIGLGAIVVFMIVFGEGAEAQAQCGKYDEMAKAFADNMQMYPTIALETGDGRIVVLFADDDATAIALILASPSGVGCLVGAGQNMQAVPKDYVPFATGS